MKPCYSRVRRRLERLLLHFARRIAAMIRDGQAFDSATVAVGSMTLFASGR